MNETQQLITDMVDLFKSGIKKEHLIGAEFEHFVVNRETLRTYDYYEENGVAAILIKMKALGWQTNDKDEAIMQMKKGEATITLEPGAQIELSVMPHETLAEVESVYRDFVTDLKSCLLPQQALVSCGFQPRTPIEEIPFIPKPRYDMMSKYLSGKGRYAHHMMKGTASTQVGVDFHSEEDFINKYRLFTALSPFIALLFDGMPIHNGRPTEGFVGRTQIWNETDPDRSGILDTSFDVGFNFKGYANYLLDTPPIFILKEGEMVFTGHEKLRDLAKGTGFSLKEVEHLMTMVFPDVRLKNFIEVRMADALPYPQNMAVVELVHALTYDDNLFKTYSEWAQSMKADQVNKWKRQIIKYGFEASIDAETAHAFIEKLVSDIMSHCPRIMHLRTVYDQVLVTKLTYAKQWQSLSDQALLEAIEVRLT